MTRRMNYATEHPLYQRWMGMKQRCSNPKNSHYRFYGGRGITVCERWKKSFSAFVEDMGMPPTLKHTLDRKDNDKGYDKTNCRWATPLEQGSNTQGTNASLGCSVAEVARRVGLKQPTLAARLRLGIPIGQAVKMPLASTGKRFSLTHKGETLSKKRWADRAGVSIQAFSYRLNNGWSLEQAIETPRRKQTFHLVTKKKGSWQIDPVLP